MFAVSFAIFCLDRITKYMALTFLQGGQSVSVVPGVFRITLVLNRGAAFGIFKGHAAVFSVVSVCVIALIVVYIMRPGALPSPKISLPLAFILGGALSNLADRLIFGHVIDFLDFRVWPVFNIADSFITMGTVMLAWGLIRR